uniref:MATH domain-containing protein n=1 Tax=Cucumis melo TaxID=3656 RepID=A0A9I9E5R8_CUCME
MHLPQDRIKFDVLLTSYEMINFDVGTLKPIKWQSLCSLSSPNSRRRRHHSRPSCPSRARLHCCHSSLSSIVFVLATTICSPFLRPRSCPALTTTVARPKPSDLYGKHTWKIEKFSQLTKRELRSNAFEVGGYKWYVDGCSFLPRDNGWDRSISWSHFAQFTIAVMASVIAANLLTSIKLIDLLCVVVTWIVDEGHRLKNKDSKLFSSLKQFSSGLRVLLTETPLQVLPQSIGAMKLYLRQFIDV